MSQLAEVYETPRLYELGQVTNLTLGQGGSSIDGSGLINQKGGGNDDVEDTVGGFDVNAP